MIYILTAIFVSLGAQANDLNPLTAGENACFQQLAGVTESEDIFALYERRLSPQERVDLMKKLIEQLPDGWDWKTEILQGTIYPPLSSAQKMQYLEELLEDSQRALCNCLDLNIPELRLPLEEAAEMLNQRLPPGQKKLELAQCRADLVS